MSSTYPGCGRDVGTSKICPHCGTDLQHRRRVRTFNLISIGVAIVGADAGPDIARWLELA